LPKHIERQDGIKQVDIPTSYSRKDKLMLSTLSQDRIDVGDNQSVDPAELIPQKLLYAGTETDISEVR